MPKFKVEQIALAPRYTGAAESLLKAMGLDEPWVVDVVTARGSVHDRQEVTNVAELQFCYDDRETEIELLNYVDGDNWLRHIDTIPGMGDSVVSHLGMHCTEHELLEWKQFFANRGIAIAQEVFTQSHESAYLRSTGRKYHYTIFDTRNVLGVDLKFIVRIEKETADALESNDPVDQVGEALEARDEGTAIGAAMRFEP